MNPTVDRIRRYKKRLAWLEDDAETWFVHARDIKDYALPWHGRLLSGTDETPNDGSKKHGNIYNNKAINAHRVLCAGIHNNLTSPILPWFLLTLDHKEYLELEGVRAWLQDCTHIMALAMAESNFYGAAFTIFEELSGFGTAVCLIERTAFGELKYTPLTFGEYYLGLNEVREPASLYRRLHMTAYEMKQRFGLWNMSPQTQNLLKADKPDERVKIIHVIQPRDTFAEQAYGARNMPYESVYFEESESENLLWESGYKTLPFAAPRWRINAGDTYGNSPIMETLGDIKELQYLEDMHNKALSLQVQPPMNVPYGMKRQGGTSLQPNGQNYYDGINPDAIRPTMQVNVDLKALLEKISIVETRIRESLFNDLFLQITERKERMTATEVRARQLERMTVLGPVVQQIMGSFLTPVIERTFEILAEEGMFPEPPQTIQGMPYKIEYTGLLAQAQKATQTASIDTLLAFVGQMAQVQSAQGSVDLLDKIDFDQSVDEIGESIGIPARIIRTDDAVEEIRAVRAQQQSAMRAMQTATEAGPALAGAAKDLGNTPMEGGKTSALDMFLQMNQLK